MTSVQSSRPTGVVIVDDHDGYRTVAAEVVNATQGFRVVGSARDREQALWVIARHRTEVDLVLMDIHLGRDDGVSLTREIIEDDVHPDVVLVTTLAIEDLPFAALDCGARGYLPKSELSPTTLTEVGQGVYDWPDVNPARGARR